MKTWEEVIPLMKSGYHHQMMEKINEIRKEKTVYPPPELVFNALELTPFDEVKVVLLGQDPYHGRGQAHGLAFSVPEGKKAPPSLRNVFKEIEADIYNGEPQEFSPDLTRWAKQGVLLLNVTLTVEAGKANAHRRLGWGQFTDQIIEKLSQEKEHLVFLLWGANAQAKKPLIDETKHLVLEAPHPSPYSAERGFFGSRHFSQANRYLEAHGKEPIKW